jgi:2-phosphosulfolactate phosphatase
MSKKDLEICFSPALYEPGRFAGSIVVVIDILRATSSICTAFENGASSIIPIGTIPEAREYKKRGYLVAAERDGIVLDFADFGNSPFNFTRERVTGRTIAYSTTNGTGIIKMAESAGELIIGSFLNISAVIKWVASRDSNVLLFCSGWKNRFNLEDAVCAGAMAERLLATSLYTTICDSARAALDLWAIAKTDLPGYIDKAAHRSRLREKKLDDCIRFCLTMDYTDVVPVLKDGILVRSE